MIIEYRIPMPLTVEEFHRGQLHMVAEKSLEVGEGAADEGVEWMRNEPYDNTDGHWGKSPITGVTVPRNKGQYTLKRYHIKSKLPGVVSTLAPSTSMWILEEAWNAYPHCKTVLVNGYLSIDKFRIDVETIHVADDAGNLENVVGLSPAELKERKVELLNIVDAYSGPKSEHPEYNALTYKSAKTGRGPLPGKDWMATTRPIMCAYKVVRADFKYFGLQGTVEGKIRDAQRDLFQKTLCQAYATLDRWVEKSMADVRAMETEVARKSEAVVLRLRAKGEAPPLANDGYWLKGEGGAAAAAAPVADGAAVGGAGAGGK